MLIVVAYIWSKSEVAWDLSPLVNSIDAMSTDQLNSIRSSQSSPLNLITITIHNHPCAPRHQQRVHLQEEYQNEKTNDIFHLQPEPWADTLITRVFMTLALPQGQIA